MNWMRAYGHSSWLNHAWSLSVEEQFYMVWPILFVCLFRRGGYRWVRTGSIVVLAGATATPAIRSAIGEDALVLYNSTDTHGAIALMGGCCLAAIAPVGSSLRSHWIGGFSRMAIVPILAAFGFLLTSTMWTDARYYPRRISCCHARLRSPDLLGTSTVTVECGLEAACLGVGGATVLRHLSLALSPPGGHRQDVARPAVKPQSPARGRRAVDRRSGRPVLLRRRESDSEPSCLDASPPVVNRPSYCQMTGRTPWPSTMRLTMRSTLVLV